MGAISRRNVALSSGGNTATITNNKSLQTTLSPASQTAFGEVLTAQPFPVIAYEFNYNINADLLDARQNASGTITVSSTRAAVASGAAANSAAYLVGLRTIRYRPGEGVCARFTALFTTGVANNTQVIGVGDVGDGYFFGYNGTSFGIMRRYGGAPEVRTLTVSTKSTTAEDITITLDGDEVTDVTVSDATATNATTTANEIAAYDYSSVGSGWTARAVGATVVFTSWTAGPRTGTYSLSGAVTAVGTFARTLAGVATNEEWVAQSSWNGDDIFDGNGASGVTLDQTKGNVYQIKYQWLGFGLVSFFIEDPNDGELHLVHAIKYANANTTPSTINPGFKFRVESVNTSNTSNVILYAPCFAAFIEGYAGSFGRNFGVKASATLSTANETPITSIRLKEVYQSALSRIQLKVNLVDVAVDHTKNVSINVYANPTLTGASFADVSAAASSLQQDTSATAATGGTLLYSISLGQTGNQSINLLSDSRIGLFEAGDVLTFTAAPASLTGAVAAVGLNLIEMF